MPWEIEDNGNGDERSYFRAPTHGRTAQQNYAQYGTGDWVGDNRRMASGARPQTPDQRYSNTPDYGTPEWVQGQKQRAAQQRPQPEKPSYSGYGTPFSGKMAPTVYSQSYIDKWMDDSFQSMIGDGGKWSQMGWGNMFTDLLDSGNYDAWKDWYSYGDPGVGAQIFMQTYGDEYKDLLKDGIDSIWKDGQWNDALMRQIFESEIKSNPTYAEQFTSDDMDLIRSLVGNTDYFGDDYRDAMRGLGVGWVGYDQAKLDNPNLAFTDWYTQEYQTDPEKLKAMYDQAYYNVPIWWDAANDAAQRTSGKSDKKGVISQAFDWLADEGFQAMLDSVGDILKGDPNKSKK